jgi:hypothetical protein
MDLGIDYWKQARFEYRDVHNNKTLVYFILWDQSGSDTGYTAWTNTYDAYGNLISKVGYPSDKSGSILNCGDSSAYTYAQVTISSVHAKPLVQSSNISIVQTPAALRVNASGITSLQLYDLSGRRIASINQAAAPSITLDFRKVRLPIATGLYLAQVTTKNGVLTHRVSIATTRQKGFR